MSSFLTKPIVSIIMGSQSDYDTLKNASNFLEDMDIPHEEKIISAHRTPQRLFQYAQNAHKEGIQVIIAGAGGAAHLPGMVASLTHLPVIGVPVKSSILQGVDSLLSIVSMPSGVSVATMAIGVAGAKNAGLMASQILALENEYYRKNLIQWRKTQSKNVAEIPS